MEIPFSSSLPDGVQKSLGLPGGAGTIGKAVLGILVTAIAAWGILKALKRLHRR
jgi:hypothetical protein